MADWSSLPEGFVSLIAKCQLDDNDIDCYMNLRGVCKRWRDSTDDPMVDGVDPRFQPKSWAVLNNYGFLSGSCVVSMVNLHTSRVIEKKIPKFRDYYYFFNATDGGFVVLGEASFPDYHAWVLNPFTGFKVCFTVPMFSVAAGIKAVAVTNTFPMMRLFVSDLWTYLGWAYPNAGDFHREYIAPYHSYHASMKKVGDNVYVANRHGSIASINANDEGNQMTPIIQADEEAFWEWEEDAPSFYLVESAGELLLVTSTRIGEEGRLFVQVHKVDTERKVLELVMDIGRRAIFISQVRSFVVNAFPTIEAGCIYFVDATMKSLFNDGIIATSFRLADQTQEDIMDWGNLRIWCGPSGPPTLVEVLSDYCRFVPLSQYKFVNSEEEDELEGFEWDDNGSKESDA
ncbi:hypothetical protein QOZ80_6AG0516340 [Eleusine coracana subsp. coracana]|nr:hypothetical protein QOZ80_6AG0516340 [Eleusine coracana subsp. coracana]